MLSLCTLALTVCVVLADGLLPEDESEVYRSTRDYLRIPQRVWPDGIVPYELHPETSEFQINEIIRVQKTYERFTCVRFVPYSDWTKKAGVGILYFHQLPGKCQSYIGNLRRKQSISCCAGISCMHELGHALGLAHDHQSSNPMRYRIIQIYPENIQVWKWYSQLPLKWYVSNQYDISSYMHYVPNGFQKYGHGPTYEIVERDLRDVLDSSSYYMNRDVSVFHKCHKLACPDFPIKCENDGYPTLLDNKCSCVCPPGLDPDTGCTTILKQDPADLTFPSGNYALLATKEGCPNEKFFTEGIVRLVTRGGNTFSSDFDLKGTFTSTLVELHFCTHQSPADKQNVWPVGYYCLYRKGGECPDDFFERFVKYDGKESPSEQPVTEGDAPDGKFGENTKLLFCCRRGFQNYELHLPSRKPFALVRYGFEACQEIRSMHFSEQRLIIANGYEGVAKTEHGVARELDDGRFETKICSYRPAFINCGDAVELTPTNRSVTFSAPEKDDLECFWFIKAPAGDKIILEFSSVNIPCTDQANLEVRPYKIGTRGQSYCRDGLKRRFVTILNTLHIKLTTQWATRVNFTAKAILIEASKMCYLSEDYGESYAGKVDYTETFQPCKPWALARHCWNNSFEYIEGRDLLEENYCRNPSRKSGSRPWCYTNITGCVRNYCDVCGYEGRFDLGRSCDKVKEFGLCKKYIDRCPETCTDIIPEPGKVVLSEIECLSAPDISGAKLPKARKSSYSVGDKVYHKCTENGKEVVATCLTTGQWSHQPVFDCSDDQKPCPARTAEDFLDSKLVYPIQDTYTEGDNVTFKCTKQENTRVSFCQANGEWTEIDEICSHCPDGWHFYSTLKGENKCYKHFTTKAIRDEASANCSKLGAILATPKTETLNEFIQFFSGVGAQPWIGLKRVDGTWTWDDGETMSTSSYSNWWFNPKADSNCAFLYREGRWSGIFCDENRRDYFYLRTYVCQMDSK